MKEWTKILQNFVFGQELRPRILITTELLLVHQILRLIILC